MSAPPPADNRIRFDRTINLGHVLTIVSFLLLTLTQWNIMDKRVTVLEESRMTQRERNTTQETMAKEKSQEVREALTDLKRSIEKLSDKMTEAK